MAGLIPISAETKGGVGLEFMSGYRGVTFGKDLTDKELRVLAVLKK
jgi:hypothetical protein